MIGDLSSILMAVSVVLAAFSGLPLLFRLTSAITGQRIATIMVVVSSLCGISGALACLLTRSNISWNIASNFPFAPITLGIDPLSAFFALPILLVSSCCSIYGLHYWKAEENQRTTPKLTLFFGLMVASMLLVTMARSAAPFLFAWEIMALAAYFILTTDDHIPEVRDAGTVYMICTHTGTLILFAFFAILNATTGSFAFPATASLSAATPIATVIFICALFGFGFKAGIMPLHVWLPGAHANAPSHVSAIMSGVILKIGIYGIVRSLSFFRDIPLWWGVLILILGMVSGVVGVLYALGQHDIKRLLAYHSIENIGIIVMGIGVATLGSSLNSSLLILLGMSGALLHVLNHATFKALLFLGAGSIIHATGTRELEKMGGLLKNMPITALTFLTGAVAICGLPPLNGFVSELLIYLGFFNTVIFQEGSAAFTAALAAPALALVGGLAVACFVKVFGVVFLGVPRSKESEHCHEAESLMRLPMIFLALICFTIGLVPIMLSRLLQSAVTACYSENLQFPLLINTAPMLSVSICGILLIIGLAFIWQYYSRKLQKKPLSSASTWGCSYLAPTPRMQYTASSFADLLVSFFNGVLQQENHPPHITGVFSKPAHFASHLPETVLEKIYQPLLIWGHEKLQPIRKLQNGHLHIYILYTVITLVVLITISI